MRSPSLARPGAVAARPPDAEVAGHYGDPLREQRGLAEGTALVDRSHRGVIRIAGPDRLGWLHSLTSQHLSELSPGVVTEGLVLSPHGHVEHHFVAMDDGEATWLDVEPGTADALVSYLESMRFLLRVEVADVSADWAVVTVTGSPPAPPGVQVRPRGWPDPAEDWLLPRDRLADLVAGPPAPLAGHDAWEALRIAAGHPRLGFETDHRTIPHEVGWIGSAVHLDKGCYRGQETVARVQNLGRPPRRLVFLHLDGSDEQLPAHGDDVQVGGRSVGFVGSAARHYELGPIALALVKRAVADDEVLTAGGVAAKATGVVAA